MPKMPPSPPAQGGMLPKLRPKPPLLRLLAAVLSAAALLAATSGPVAAEAPTRQGYVAQLEGVCKPSDQATQRAMKGVRDDVKAERDAVAAAKFARAGTIFDRTVSTIARVPRPPADLGRLKKWFAYLGRQEEYLKQITTHLRQGQTIAAQRSTARFIHNGNLANNVVLAFGFNYCSFKFSRFG